MDLEIRHLRAMCAIAEAGSLSQAASRLGISQPSLTGLLQRMERLVNGQLFERSRAGVTPTELGAQLVQRAQLLLTDLETIGADLTRDNTGPIRFGSVHMECVATLFQRLDDAFPDAKVSLTVEPSSTVLAHQLGRGNLDAAVLAVAEEQHIPLERDLAQRILLPWVPVFVALSASHPLADQPAVNLADLAHESWIRPPGAEDGSLAALRAAAREAGFTPQIRFEVPSGAGRGLITSGTAVQLVEPTSKGAPGLVIRPLVGEPLRMRLVMAWRRQRLTWEQAATVYTEAAAAYAVHAKASPVFQPWWNRHREVHPPTC
ncbi:LysR family transcriptional regulator [Actinokineospora fastidiosa]|uniref:Small neutral protease regulatory protein n=1 Tax=Actinokineospora fastidiosa TaxID=1816 RepID=A0A918GS78_9PSEU|nr:LysR family transcriptional regulator [Actinokineospora fastidiosa]GGS53924.1 small neutral protease regulatory protein [Actinokineospora fastidiosa]